MTGFSEELDRITVEDLRARLSRGEKNVLLDVRRREAWTAEPVRIPQALWLPLEEVPRRARDLPRDARIVVYCS
jgi:rhodanese-related sulfurtransferase